MLASAAAMMALSCAPPADADDLDVVRLTAHGRLTNSALLIADEEGFFADEGIRLRIVEGPRSSSQAIPLLERGDIDVLGVTVNSGFFAAVAKGAKSRIVADRGHISATACDHNGFMGRRDAFSSDSPSAAEVRGKRFSINKGGSAEFLVSKYLESLGLTVDDVQSVQLNETVEAQAIESGTLDGMHTSEPFISQLKSRGHRFIAGNSQLAPGAHFSLVLFAPSLVVKNRDLGQRFMNAYLRGARQLAEGATPRNVEIIARRTGYDSVVLKTACMPSISTEGNVNVAWLIEFQKWAVQKGYLDKVIEGDAGTDLSFAREAVARYRSGAGAN